VPRNAETGISKGRGYVTMSSLDEAKAAIIALDGSLKSVRVLQQRMFELECIISQKANKWIRTDVGRVLDRLWIVSDVDRSSIT
ncbi:28 kDa ribonucleoprotein, chloroplastic, partial [Tanacetum coccineum]